MEISQYNGKEILKIIIKMSFVKSKYFLLLSLVVLFSVPEVSSQNADAGQDSTICGAGSVILGGGDANPDYCYTWSPQAGLNDPHILHPTATPAVTTTYTLTVVGPDFSFKDQDQVTVTVVDASVTLTVEDNITQCMEGRSVTFTAEVSDDFPVSLTDPINITFYFKDAAGNEWNEEVWSWDRIEYYTADADQVPDGDADHKFTTPIYVEAENGDCSATSPTINLDVYELWIDYVKDNTTGKAWKVVVGEFISYSAIASSDCSDWQWEAPDGIWDNWGTTGGTSKTGTDLRIPYSELSSASNSDFGDAYGTIRVSCQDGEGNSHTFSSTDMTPANKVKIFFDPDLNVNGGAPSTANPPCWFVFWKDGEVVEDMDICTYDQTLDYGAWSPTDGLQLGPLACDVNGPTETLNDMSGNAFNMTGTGKHLKCVAESMTHELHHRDCYNAWGNFGTIGPNHDDTDGLPNGEEAAPSRTYFHVSDSTNHNTFNYALYAGTGYADQEVRCRIIEISPGVKATFPSKDWSKDPENPKW
ncbi:MAG TPA: hypothetical protein PKW80_11870 [Bacteroidales bacterium]|nr:hypothetical protein [Bacteroidales bacterium]